MNWHAVKAIYRFEMARTFRTLVQSIGAPVLTTSLYFVVFGSAIGSRMTQIGGVPYGAFIVPGLIMLSVLTESVGNGSFGIYMPKWAGTIYELLSAPVSTPEILLGYVGAAATKSMMVGLVILRHRRYSCRCTSSIPLGMIAFLLLTSVSFSLFGFMLGHLGRQLGETAGRAAAGGHAADFPGRQLLQHRHAAAGLAHDHPLQSRSCT